MIHINGKLVEFGKFPNGEINLKRFETDQWLPLVVKFTFESNDDLMNLLFLKKYIDSTQNHDQVTLSIVYMPYSRMDREEDYIFTLKYVCDFINSLNFTSVVVYEPHSDVTTALLNNCSAISYIRTNVNYVMEVIGFNKDLDYVMFPDAGAQKKYSNMFRGYNQLVGFKNRDFKTGRITDFSVLGNVTEGSNVLIIDDLCSGGFTFKLSADELKKQGAGDIYLFTGHCENTVLTSSTQLLDRDLIKRMFTTSSIFSGEHEKITVF